MPHLLWSRPVFGLAILCAALCGAPAQAQDAYELLNTGEYRAARAAFSRSLQPDDGDAIEGYFETYLQTGQYEDGLEQADRYLSRWSNNPHVLYVRGRLLQTVGQLEEAQQAYIAAIQAKPDYWRAGLEVADLFRATGQERQARSLYATLRNNLQQDIFTTAADLAVGAQAAARLKEYHDANDALMTALALNPDNVQHLLWHGDLYQATYDVAQAQTLYEKALEINPHRAALYIALANVTGSYARKESLAQEALRKAPNHVGAHSLQAFLSILDGRMQEATTRVEQALEINPADMEALARKATIHHLRGDTAAFAAVEREAQQIHARPAAFYRVISEGLSLRFRYPDAAFMARKAVEADPLSGAANAALGTALMRTGDTRLARRYLDRAYEEDAFNLFVANTLSLLDDAAQFRQMDSEHIRLLIHRDEADVLGPAMLREAEAAYQSMASRYPYRPRGKIVLEAYNNADDFAVRVAGVPHIGLLGVSFGDILAVNTPEARGGAPYNWARTVWHEVAHTMAIGTTDFRVPRWLTEGLSVYEEQRAYPYWAREYELRFLMAFDRDRLHRLEEIDRGFTRPAFPGQVMMSYYHAYKVVDYIVENRGFDAIIRILSALRSGRSEEQAIQEALGQTRAALDDGFRRSLRARRAELADVLQGWPDMLTEEVSGGSLEEWLKQQEENSLLGSLHAGNEALERGDLQEAETNFREALGIYPYFTGAGNAYAGLMTVYRQRAEEQALIRTLEAYLEVTPYGTAEARELSALYEARGALGPARALLRRSRTTQPYDPETLTRLAELARAQNDYASEIEMRRALLALDPVDKASAYYALARSLYANGQTPQAKRAVLQSLEIAPNFREAQELLLECVGEGP